MSLKTLLRNPAAEPIFTEREILRMTGPFILSFALSLLVGMLDTIMVSSVGDAAVSGVSIVDNVMQLVVFVFMAFGTGGAVVAGQYLGSGEREQADRCARQLVWLSGSVSVLIMLLLFAARFPILRGFFGSITPEVLREAGIYITITVFSLPAMAIFESGMAIFRAMGDSRTTLRVSLVMNTINVVGNAVLIYGFGMGTAGVAIPTLASRWVAAILAMHFLTDENKLIHLPRSLQPLADGPLIRKILKVGVPNGVENGIFQLGKLIVVRIITGFGTAAIAANAVAVILTNIISVPGWGLNNSAMTVISRCVGKSDFDQARYYHKLLTALSYAVLTVWAGVMVLFLPWTLRLFTGISPEAAAIARAMVLWHAAGTVLFWVPAFLQPTALRAAGDVNYAMTVSIVSMWLFRVGGAWLLTRCTALGAPGTWAAMGLDWAFRAALYIPRWRSGKWESKRVI
ncbi:MAG: MATE family efflux transporter [Oscillospiraceae bacterium]|nr:MATE family efflux transporter [Oscillospiraceae bacterium]